MNRATRALEIPAPPEAADDGRILLLTGGDVVQLLRGREHETMQAVREAYEAHAAGRTCLPSSSFVRFPDRERERIIALPAYLGGARESAGIKWIASFPENLRRGLDRASAVMILNSMETGRPTAILEGSVISARRTAASAALAARHLHGASAPREAGLIGCGLIGFEVARFLTAVYPEIEGFALFDLDAGRAAGFGERLRRLRPGTAVRVAASSAEVFASTPLVSLATTAVRPHIDDLSGMPAGGTVLHVSLRDFTPEVVLACDNVVDDVEHVCRAQTSVHLAAERTGGTGFIRGTLADVLLGRIPPRSPGHAVSLFSPFGLGVLDLAVARLACDLAAEQGVGMQLPSFAPPAWTDRL